MTRRRTYASDMRAFQAYEAKRNPKCNRKSAGGSHACTKPRGHVGAGDKRHSDGHYEWGKWW